MSTLAFIKVLRGLHQNSTDKLATRHGCPPKLNLPQPFMLWCLRLPSHSPFRWRMETFNGLPRPSQVIA